MIAPVTEVVSGIQEVDMPLDAQDAFRVYLATDSGGGHRSLARTADLCNVPRGTVNSWSHRYRWPQLARDIDIEVGQSQLEAALVAASSARLHIVEKLSHIAFRDEKASNRDRLEAIKQLRELSGMTGNMLDLAASVHDGTQAVEWSQADLDAMVREGRVDDLLALTRGQKLPKRNPEAA